MRTLGVSCFYHDASAALIEDGRVILAAEEERFSRIKHDIAFPHNALRFILDDLGIGINEIDQIAFYEKPLLKFERLLYQYIDTFPLSYRAFLSSMPSWFNEKLRVVKIFKKDYGYEGNIFFVNHHLAHAASAFLLSPFDKAAILTVDGVGEWSTLSYGIGKGTDIRLLKELRFPHSLGLLYSTITAFLGFSVNNSEYKVMGLSAYGDRDKTTNRYYKKINNLITTRPDGSFRLNLEYFSFHYKKRMPSKKLPVLMGLEPRRSDEPVTQEHKDIAAALQITTEEILNTIIRHVRAETGQDKLVMAGGVALNSVYNGKLISQTGVKELWIQPAAGDGGTSLGAAAYVNLRLAKDKTRHKFHSAFLGPAYTNNEIGDFLKKNRIKYTTFGNSTELVTKTARLIYDNAVIAWFQGRMEWGPRALGARSILSNPCHPQMQEILNTKVKHREKFRPFAPVVCTDDATDYFECDSPVPEPTDYMLMVYPVKEKFRDKLPSITHVDGSGRLQTIGREQQPLYYDLIKEFGKLSGIPILINTSFNIRGEPIVCNPYDAFKCMMGTGIDYLVIGEYLIKREDNPDYIWDSEKNAKD